MSKVTSASANTLVAIMMVFLSLHVRAALGNLTLVTRLRSTAVDDALHTLDSNNDGVISKSEIAVYAQSQGIGAEDILGDFSAIDTNGDGNLDGTEISKALNDPDTQSATQQVPANSAAVTASLAPVAPKSVIASLAAETHSAMMKKPTSAAAVSASVEPVSPEPLIAAASANTKSAKSFTSDSTKSTDAQWDGLLEINALQKDAEKQAGKIMATELSSHVQELLKQSAIDKASAESYRKKATFLRGSATKLLETTLRDTQRVAIETTSNATNAKLPQLKDLRFQERKALRVAAQHREHARHAMDEVVKAQALLAKPLQIAVA
jgi:hypothetical protein